MSHSMDRRGFIAGGLAAGALAAPPAGAGGGLICLQKGTAAFSRRLQSVLWNAQQSDGSWRSETYGLLRSGQALTPFVLHALAESHPDNIRDDRATKAIGWIARHLRDGCLGVADPDILEYPVYATSLALRCFDLRDDIQSEAEAMRTFLVGQQFVEHRGFAPESLAYGGWGFGGFHPPGETGHMDLAHTRWALQALRSDSGATSVKDQALGDKAQQLLRLLQKHPSETRNQPLEAPSGELASRRPRFDGGFYFSPIVLGANKGRVERSGNRAYFRSYATATCDGVLALLAAGADVDDPRVVAARSWLEAHPDWEYPFGIPTDYHEPWGDAVFFYHQAVRAEVYRRLEMPGDWPRELLMRIRKRADDNDRIVNPNGLMKEDDPILCTALALKAMGEAQKHIGWAKRSRS